MNFSLNSFNHEIFKNFKNFFSSNPIQCDKSENYCIQQIFHVENQLPI